MSTAGKVLTVLVMLMAVVWVLLASTVAQLNHNWSEPVAKREPLIEKLEADNVTAAHDYTVLRDQTYQEQSDTDNGLAVLENRMVDLEKRRAQEIESATRVKFQLEGMDATAKAAVAQHEQRKADLVAETEETEKLKLDVNRLMKENADLLARVDELRKTFQTALKSSREKAGLPALSLDSK